MTMFLQEYAVKCTQCTQEHTGKKIFPRVRSPNPPQDLGREVMLFSKGDTVLASNKEFTG